MFYATHPQPNKSSHHLSEDLNILRDYRLSPWISGNCVGEVRQRERMPLASLTVFDELLFHESPNT